MNATKITYRDFAAEINTREGELAYGSETALLGHFVSRMAELGGRDWRESDAVLAADEAAWWRRAYDLYEQDTQLPADEQSEDVQDIFDRV